jgi:lipopolysaccharide biosynthesis glycosyltransferase
MNIVFCADRVVLPGLHVAAYSVLENIRFSPEIKQVSFSVFSDVLDESDAALLRQTLAPLKKDFTLALRRMDVSQLAGFPALNSSLAAYYRILAAQIIDTDRFLYLDADILCDMDISKLYGIDMGTHPAGMVPEAPLSGAVDRFVAEQLGNNSSEPYFNSGVILANVVEWRRQRVSEKAIEYIAKNHPPYHDQSALNAVLHGNIMSLDERYNCIANMRKNWPFLKQPYGKTGRLVHFVDYPKPWDLLGEFLHPQYRHWRAVLDKTAIKNFRSWHATSSRKFPRSPKAKMGYRKAFKDKLLFGSYSRGLLKEVKGVPQT